MTDNLVSFSSMHITQQLLRLTPRYHFGSQVGGAWFGCAKPFLYPTLFPLTTLKTNKRLMQLIKHRPTPGFGFPVPSTGLTPSWPHEMYFWSPHLKVSWKTPCSPRSTNPLGHLCRMHACIHMENVSAWVDAVTPRFGFIVVRVLH